MCKIQWNIDLEIEKLCIYGKMFNFNKGICVEADRALDLSLHLYSLSWGC